MCDALLLRGSLIVDESNLTGEAHPVGKSSLSSLKEIEQNLVWLYEGSSVL